MRLFKKSEPAVKKPELEASARFGMTMDKSWAMWVDYKLKEFENYPAPAWIDLYLQGFANRALNTFKQPEVFEILKRDLLESGVAEEDVKNLENEIRKSKLKVYFAKGTKEKS